MIGDRPAGRFFVNEAHQELPDAQRVMHFEFSDGMLANGVKFWEALYLAALFNCYLSESGRPHLGFGLTDAVYFELPNTADFDLLDFPFPIEKKERFIHLDDYPGYRRFLPRISSAVSSLPFVRGMAAIQAVLGLRWDFFSDYLIQMYRMMFGCDFPRELSAREVSYVKRYLSQFLKLFLKSYQDVVEQPLANFVLLLTLSCCSVYPHLECHNYGFSLLVMTNLFCPNLQHKATFVTIALLNALVVDPKLQSLSRVPIPDLKIINALESESPSCSLWREIFSSSTVYKNALEGLLKSENADFSHSFDAAAIFKQTIVTLSYFYRLVLLRTRIFLRESVILEEETGCGKTSMIQFIRAALSLPWNDDGHQLSHVLADALNFHGGVGRDEFLRYIEEIKTSSRPRVAFCDEINTSVDCSFVSH
jgi:hypothetical protein